MAYLAKSGLFGGAKNQHLPVFNHGRCVMAADDSAFGAHDGRTAKKETYFMGFTGNGHRVVVVLCFLFDVLQRYTADNGLSH